jgi:hypothetical protein
VAVFTALRPDDHTEDPSSEWIALFDAILTALPSAATELTDRQRRCPSVGRRARSEIDGR